MRFIPLGKAELRRPIGVTWIYADYLIDDPKYMTAKQIHDHIVQELSRLYSADQLSRITSVIDCETMTQ